MDDKKKASIGITSEMAKTAINGANKSEIKTLKKAILAK